MAALSPFSQRDFSRGVYSNVNTFIAPQNSVAHSMNFIFDEIYGAMRVRNGSTIVGSQLTSDNNVLGMHNFRDRDGGNHALIAGVNGTIYNVASGATLRTGMSTTATMRFETYLDEVVVQNGTDSPLSFTGTGSFAASTTLNTASMPIGVDVLGYKDRLFVLQASGILRGSSIPASPNYNTISWSSGNITIPIDPDQSSYAGAAVGLAKVSGLLIILKERAMYTYNGSATQADFLYNIGCSSARSIATGYGTVFFFNPEGIFMTRGSQPVKISRPVQTYIDGMSSANYSSVAGYADNRYYWCSLGNVTIGLTTYSNVVLRYTISTQEWAVFSFPNRLTAFSMYIDGTTTKTAYGDSTARVYTHEGTTDNSTAISFEMISRELDFGSRGLLKDVHNKLLMYSRNSSDVEVQIRMDDKEFITIGHAVKEVDEIVLSEPIIGHFFEVRIIGSSSGAAPVIYGFDFPNIGTSGFTTIE